MLLRFAGSSDAVEKRWCAWMAPLSRYRGRNQRLDTGPPQVGDMKIRCRGFHHGEVSLAVV